MQKQVGCLVTARTGLEHITISTLFKSLGTVGETAIEGAVIEGTIRDDHTRHKASLLLRYQSPEQPLPDRHIRRMLIFVGLTRLKVGYGCLVLLSNSHSGIYMGRYVCVWV